MRFNSFIPCCTGCYRAAVVAAAISRLRMVFDEILGTEETTNLNDSFSTDAINVSAPPPSPESHSQANPTFHFSQTQRVVPTSSSTTASSGFCYSFPTTNDKGKFDDVPRSSPHSLVQRPPATSLSDGIKLEFPFVHSSNQLGEADSRRGNTRSPTSMNKVELMIHTFLKDHIGYYPHFKLIER